MVLIKFDIVDDEFRELVKEDICEKIKGIFFEDVEIIEVDFIFKRGIDIFIEKIDKMSDDIEDKNENFLVRFNIDRVFLIKGFGIVIIGILIEGKISIEDDLVIYL